MIRSTVVALSIAAVATTATTSAQEHATFTLRSGERMSGQLMDLGGIGFTVRINGQERQIPASDMAVIDFTGGGATQSDWDRLNSGQFAVLKDGQIITGQLTDVGGSSPLRLSFTVSGANRDLQSSEVARIVLARPNDVPSTAPPATGGGAAPQGITVSAQQGWTATGLVVSRGETLTLNATGEIGFREGATASPSGWFTALAAPSWSSSTGRRASRRRRPMAGTRSATSACPASRRSLAGSTPPAIAGGCGRCGCSPASARPRTRTRASRR